MKKWIVIFCALLALPTFAAHCKIQQDRFAIANTNTPQASAFLAKLQGLIKKNKVDDILNLVRYPLRNPLAKNLPAFKNKKQLQKQYSQIFNKQVQSAIVKQQSKKLFVNYQGVMIGNGEIWYDNAGTLNKPDIKIIAVNHHLKIK